MNYPYVGRLKEEYDNKEDYTIQPLIVLFTSPRNGAILAGHFSIPSKHRFFKLEDDWLESRFEPVITNEWIEKHTKDTPNGLADSSTDIE